MNGRPPSLLTPEEYQLVVAPALQVAAELAAQRGDPHLYNDMASMLALLGMVSALTRMHLQQPAGEGSAREELEAAPLAASALVFTESNLEPDEVEQCLRALSAAYLKLLREGVLGPQEAYVEQAFASLRAGNRAAGIHSLRQAAHAMARAVDAWEGREASALEPRA